MPIDVKIPEVGESIVEVQIGEWLKAEGDVVQKDDSLAMIESEKTNFELPSPASGKLTRIVSQAGETVKVGATIAQIEPDGAPQPAEAEQKKPEEPAKKTGDEPPPSDPESAPSPKKDRPPAKAKAPPVRRQRDEPRRPAPKPSEPDTPAPAEEEPTPAPEPEPAEGAPAKPLQVQAKPEPADGREEEIVPMTMLRRTVARRLVEAQQNMAMLTTFNEVDMGAVQTLRHEHREVFEKRYGIRLGLMSFFVKAAIAALKEFPQLNAEVRGNDIVYHNYFDIGVAIATPQGLVVPVLTNAERLSFAEIEKAIADFASRAKERHLKPEELEGGTFTITNGGVFGSLLSTPLINPPQTGILGLHTIVDRPVAREGNVVIRPMMYVALTYDHRLVDGREAVLFLRRVKEIVEEPARMLIEA